MSTNTLVPIDAAMVDAIPEPVYSCADYDCALETSYPADMLRWFGGEPDHDIGPGYYCAYCLEHHCINEEDLGISLKDAISALQ